MIVNKLLKTHKTHVKYIHHLRHINTKVEVCVYIYKHVLQKIGHETSFEALRILGKKSSYKSPKAIYQLLVNT